MYQIEIQNLHSVAMWADVTTRRHTTQRIYVWRKQEGKRGFKYFIKVIFLRVLYKKITILKIFYSKVIDLTTPSVKILYTKNNGITIYKRIARQKQINKYQPSELLSVSIKTNVNVFPLISEHKNKMFHFNAEQIRTRIVFFSNAAMIHKR